MFIYAHEPCVKLFIVVFTLCGWATASAFCFAWESKEKQVWNSFCARVYNIEFLTVAVTKALSHAWKYQEELEELADTEM